MLDLYIEVSGKHKSVEVPTGVAQFDVVCNRYGTLTVTADPETLARIGGRDIFGPPEPVRALLLDRIARAWYDAECPPWVGVYERGAD